MINDLFALAQQGGPIGERAQMALLITEQHNKGEISTDEYQELMLDLSRLDEVTDQASSIEVKTLLVTAIWAVAQLR
jgi:putative AlgH/UPF0301 family transcriptional regulator